MKSALPWIMILLLAGGAGAADKYVGPKFYIHLMHREDRSCTENFPVVDEVEELADELDTCGEIDVFPVIFWSRGVTGAQFGLAWPEEWGSCEFSLCADFAISGIVNPGDLIAIAWTKCQVGQGVIPGYARLSAGTPGYIEYYCPGNFRLMASDCDFTEQDADSVFSGRVDCQNAALPTTWGEVKAMYR